MTTKPTLPIERIEVPLDGERNVLDIARKAGIEIPTFCYHSDLSIYGACRLCLVDVEGRGVVASCSTPPEAGMKVRTHTEEIRQMRRIALELILANHEQTCPTCAKSTSCKPAGIGPATGRPPTSASRRRTSRSPVDRSSLSLVRDPNKCILCGDCVRACEEIQGIGAIDFAYRGAAACVVPAFGKNLSDVECVNCGLVRLGLPDRRPDAAIRESTRSGKSLESPAKTVVAQIAPAVRVALGEAVWHGAGKHRDRTDHRGLEGAGVRPGLRHQLRGRPDG